MTSGANELKERVEMIAEILKKIQPKITKTAHRIETDAFNDFNIIVGDMNFRFNRTFSEHINEVN